MMTPAADSPQAEQAMQQEDHMQQLISEGFEPVYPDEYEYNMDKIQTIDDVRKFLTELGTPTLTLFPGVSLEDAGKDPDVWVKVEYQEVETPQDGEAS